MSILLILALSTFSLIFGSPPSTSEAVTIPAKTKFVLVKADVSGYTLHKQNASNQQVLNTATIGELASNPYPAKAYKRSRFDFKMPTLSFPERTFDQFDKPPSLTKNAVVDTETILRN